MFKSLCERVGYVALPAFTGTRVMMLPVVLGEPESLPASLDGWRHPFEALCGLEHAVAYRGQVGYLTIDEKTVAAGETHRRSGLHVDGVYRGLAGGWGGGGGGAWGGIGTGMLTVSNAHGCRAWRQVFDGISGPEGECEHLRAQCQRPAQIDLANNEVWWFDGLCVHESRPMLGTVDRQFVRVSLPSQAPWFEGYTVNETGVLPTGPILPRRDAFMGDRIA